MRFSLSQILFILVLSILVLRLKPDLFYSFIRKLKKNFKKSF